LVHRWSLKIEKSGYLERTSCIGCGSGFQPRKLNDRGWKPLPQGVFYGSLDFPDKRLEKFTTIFSTQSIRLQFLNFPTAQHLIFLNSQPLNFSTSQPLNF
jgi:hypothetical protein